MLLMFYWSVELCLIDIRTFSSEQIYIQNNWSKKIVPYADSLMKLKMLITYKCRSQVRGKLDEVLQRLCFTTVAAYVLGSQWRGWPFRLTLNWLTAAWSALK